ncbi:MAG: hypothetical protein JXA25_01905 [Anaerolineales bacterium]|nr:hypothetical protein [Anaerolineales bacterium]
MAKTEQRINRALKQMYGSQDWERVSKAIFKRMGQFQQAYGSGTASPRELFHQSDVFMITYPDILRDSEHKPLENLRAFYQSELSSIVNTIHILPFFPYSSDDGFSVMDFYSVDPTLGSWEDISHLKDTGCRLMFDTVINHVSTGSDWFLGFLNGDERYLDYFITVDPDADLSMVTRPRSLPLLTRFETAGGPKYVWTTFSADQIDLNFSNPDTLLAILDVILFYIRQGADIIRLDAIPYLWKEIGTTCIHLPQAHAFVQLLRAVLDELKPDVLVIAEANVPHDENISYLGDGTDEAHMVYQFSLPPLTAHALISGSSEYLSSWASNLNTPSPGTSFLNFTASHDGVGVRPAAGILPEKEVARLIKQTLAHGGKISSKTNQDGSKSPYELNINYYDLLNDPASTEPQELQVNRFLASQAIMLMVKGIPGLYFHSLVGSRNDYEGVAKTGHARSINREKLQLIPFLEELQDPGSLRNAVFSRYKSLLEVRTRESSFHPSGGQEVLDAGPAVFAVLRTSPDGSEQILAMQNVASAEQEVHIRLPETVNQKQQSGWHDLLSFEQYHLEAGVVSLKLSPYQTVWLKLSSPDNLSLH